MPKNQKSSLTIQGRPLPDSDAAAQDLQARLGHIAARAGSYILGAMKPNEQRPLPDPLLFSPHNKMSRFGSTHYGIMMPDLPAPHNFMAFASILGIPGAKIADGKHACKERGPADTAVLVHGTAAAVDQAFSSYSLAQDMDLTANGSSIGFSGAAKLSADYPCFHLTSQRPGFEADLALTATGDITWFAHSPIYQHYSLLTRYSGTIRTDDTCTDVHGLCTLEYFRSVSLHKPLNRLLPTTWRLPLDFFTYQVINLDENTQLLLACIMVYGQPGLRAAYLRRDGGGSEMIDDKACFQVIAANDQPAVTPDGQLMTLPRTFRWRVAGKKDQFDIHATVDTPMLFGLADGYVGGYQWHGTHNGHSVTGRGYIEYIDKRGS